MKIREDRLQDVNIKNRYRKLTLLLLNHLA